MGIVRLGHFIYAIISLHEFVLLLEFHLPTWSRIFLGFSDCGRLAQVRLFHWLLQLELPPDPLLLFKAISDPLQLLFLLLPEVLESLQLILSGLNLQSSNFIILLFRLCKELLPLSFFFAKLPQSLLFGFLL